MRTPELKLPSPRPKAKMDYAPQLHAACSVELWRRAEEAIKKLNTTQSELVRCAVEFYLDTIEEQAKV